MQEAQTKAKDKKDEDERRSVPQEKKQTVVQEKKPVRTKKQKKSCSKPKVEKARKIEDEEAEEFEPVEGARPALCVGKRKSKLKWKSEDSDPPSKTVGTVDEGDGSGSRSAESPPSPPQNELNVEPLKDALAELTLEKQKLKETCERLRQRVKRRDRKIEKLQKELKAKNSEEAEAVGTPAATPPTERIVTQIKQELETAKAQLSKQSHEAEKNKADMQRLLGEAKRNTTAVEPAKDKKAKDGKGEDEETVGTETWRLLRTF